MVRLLEAIRPLAIGLNALILAVGAYYASQGWYVPATGAILGALNLLTLTRLGAEGPTRFVALIPAVLAVMGGAMGLGMAAAGYAASEPAMMVAVGLPGLLYFLAGTLTILHVLLVSLGHVRQPAPRH